MPSKKVLILHYPSFIFFIVMILLNYLVEKKASAIATTPEYTSVRMSRFTDFPILSF